MLKEKKIICVIPARLNSSRLPRKILAPLLGKPLIRRTWEAAVQVPFFDEVVIAVDDPETAEVVEGFGARWIMTDVLCASGTERIVEIRKRNILQSDIWVGWQADEPFLSVKILEDLLQSIEDCDTDVWTLKTKIRQQKQFEDPNVCKVVCDRSGKALYFSRSPIPYNRDGGVFDTFRHIGIYAYSDAAVRKIERIEPCSLDRSESLEQLRFLFGGLAIRVHETEESSVGIDVPEDLVAAEAYLTNGALPALSGSFH